MERVVMYSTTWCGHCRRLARQLAEAGIPFEVVDLDRHREHEAKIVAKTGGFRTVPTIEIGTRLLVNPSVTEVASALAAAS
ncbi:MAG: glutaredoxin family protein [Actinomycetota bacterium]